MVSQERASGGGQQALYANFVFSFGVVLGLLAIISGSSSLWERQEVQAVPSAAYGLAVALILLLFSCLILRFRLSQISFSVFGFTAGLVLLFFSDFMSRDYSFLRAPSIRGEILLAGLFALFFIRREARWFFSILLPLTLVLLICCFYITSAGRMVFSDDHPVFLYRLFLLKENFPNIPVFHPMWSAGRDTLHLFATGTLNVFFLSAPLIYFLDLFSNYNSIICFVLFAVVPAGSYFAAQQLQIPRPGAALAAILALSSSTYWYDWALRYGTMGFITSSALIPINIVLATRMLDAEYQLNWKEVFLFVASFSLMLFWSPAGLVFLPIIALALLRFGRLIRDKKRVIVLCLLVAINLPWIVLFWSGWNVSKFVGTSHTHAAESSEVVVSETAHQDRAFRDAPSSVQPRSVLKKLRELALRINPLVLVLLLPGLPLLPKRFRWIYFATIVWLLILGTVFHSLKPQLELDRMLVILVFCSSVPVAAALVELISETFARPTWFRSSLLSLSAAFLITAVIVIGSMLTNRELFRYYHQGPEVEEVAAIIGKEAGAGRVLFSAMVIHHLSHGHLAPLTALSGKPILAESHLHEHWKTVDAIPQFFRGRGDEGVLEYFDLMNVSLVAAHKREWLNYFRERPAQFPFVAKAGKFSFFRVQAFRDNYFLEGSGEILRQDHSGLRLRVDSKSAIIKFRYFPSIFSTNCQLSAFEVFPGRNFIKLDNCTPGVEFEIRSLPFWKRLLYGV